MTMQRHSSSESQLSCPGCGASLEFNPKRGQMECPYCGRREAIARNKTSLLAEQSFEAHLNEKHTQLAALSRQAVEVQCPGCRARFTFEPPTVAGKCAFCNTNIVAQPRTASPVVTPGGVVPFTIGQRQAREKVSEWLRQRWFAPKGLKRLSQHAGLQGIYLPFWTYDCKTCSQYRGKRGDRHTRTETYTTTDNDGRTITDIREVVETHRTRVSGSVDYAFDDVLVAAAESVDQNHLRAVEGWDLSELAPYNASYLSGFKVQRYQINLKEGFERAKKKMETEIRRAVECKIGGDEQCIDSLSTSYSDITFKHILLPVWTGAYEFKGRRYTIVVNGQSGKVCGDRPFSWLQIAFAILVAIVILGILVSVL
ncbi:hypothetical protein P7L53_08275 [Thermoleptolyngbya sichuanensis XZ-Cy5]|uniref:hypothetical protein n=1 Tax=Thermoleptolyngbya sichuanensis TaxID=2885951 RepID=UPI00240DC276|nr:hypothetical protein [Thermoleptolyngbya sichuanensis]MDG2616240.1 hypothetical protein [Thermoleptolyngbya sichuanensis XZ-Cy5]